MAVRHRDERATSQVASSAKAIATAMRFQCPVSTSSCSSPGGGELVVLGAPVVLRGSPARGERPGVLEAVQGGEERPGPDVEGVARDLLDAARDAESVELTEGERLEDEQVERALQEVGLGGRHGRIGCR